MLQATQCAARRGGDGRASSLSLRMASSCGPRPHSAPDGFPINGWPAQQDTDIPPPRSVRSLSSVGLWSLEKGRALVSLAREHEDLRLENRSLREAVARARREARLWLDKERAEVLARQLEQEELKELTAEAQRLVRLKESRLPPLPCGRTPTMEREVRQQADALLWEEHASAWRRMKAHFIKPKRAVPGQALSPPRPGTPIAVTPRITQIEQARLSVTSAKLTAVRRPQRGDAA